MNELLATKGKNTIKELLSECTRKQQKQFKRIFSHENQDISIDEVVDKLEDSKIDSALSICQRTVNKNNLENGDFDSPQKPTERSRSDETDKKEPMTKAEYNSELDEIRGDIKRENEENV